MPHLGVNVDHVATVRQARGCEEPNLVAAALQALRAGADGIVVHLREDRRHIQEEDLWKLKRVVKKKLNLEMAAIPAIVRIARRLRPNQATIVPEKRRELTTEGGLNLTRNTRRLKEAIEKLQGDSIAVSLFIDPTVADVERASRLGAQAVEIHTGAYANTSSRRRRRQELARLKRAAQRAKTLSLAVYAGHVLTYANVRPVAALTEIEELNI